MRLKTGNATSPVSRPPLGARHPLGQFAKRWRPSTRVLVALCGVFPYALVAASPSVPAGSRAAYEVDSCSARDLNQVGTDNKLRASPAPEGAEIVGDTLTVGTGILYLRGNRIPPPYAFAVHDTVLVVNGYVLQRARSRVVRSQLPIRPPAHTNQDIHTYLFACLDSLRRDGASMASRIQCARTILESFPDIVAGVTEVSSELLEVAWRNRNEPELIHFTQRRIGQRSTRDRLRDELRVISSSLGAGGYFLVGEGGISSGPERSLPQLYREIAAAMASLQGASAAVAWPADALLPRATAVELATPHHLELAP